nr:uncharacterized mitochondrial protein AtMg00810-like [Tanacetum cinerariifolium]
MICDLTHINSLKQEPRAWYDKLSSFLIEHGFTRDADHAGCKDDCKSTSGGLQFLGEKLVSWSLKRQDCTAMSTAEAEYVSLYACCAQVIWRHTQLLNYGYKYNRIPLYCDSKKYQLADLFTKALPKECFEYLVHRIVIIMAAQQQHVADVHPYELCPSNKRYDLMDANKKIDLEHVQCPPESKILTNIIKNHPLRFSITASSSEGIYYSLHHSTSSIPYPRFTKIIIGHYMTNFLEISRHARDKYHNLKDDDIMKNILNSRRYKDKVGMKIQDTLQVSSVKHKSKEEQEARENVELVNEHLAYVEIEKMVEVQENVIDDSSIPRNDEHNILALEEEEITNEVYELKRMEKRKILEESRNIPFPTPIRSPRIHTDLVSSVTEKLQELTELQGRYGILFEHLRARFMSRKSFDTLVDHLQEVMVESLPIMVYKLVKEQVKKQVHEQVPQTTCRTSAIRPRHQDDPHDDAHPEGENSAKRQKTSEYKAYVSRESSSGQDNEKEQGPLTSGNQEQVDDYDFWTESYALDDDEIPTKWVNKSVKKFNPYARYGVEHWKNPHAKIFYIRKQKEPGKLNEMIYLNSKIIQVIKTEIHDLNFRGSFNLLRLYDEVLDSLIYKRRLPGM